MEPTSDLLSRDELGMQAMATRLGISTEEVHQRESVGRLFSYLRCGRGERVYPAYQLAAEIYPDLLRTAVEALTANGPLLDTFFNGCDCDLADLRVREVLAGRSLVLRTLDKDAAWLLSLPMACRMQAVMGALERLEAIVKGW